MWLRRESETEALLESQDEGVCKRLAHSHGWRDMHRGSDDRYPSLSEGVPPFPKQCLHKPYLWRGCNRQMPL